MSVQKNIGKREGGKYWYTPYALFLKERKQNVINILSSPLERQFQIPLIPLIFTLCRHWKNKP